MVGLLKQAQVLKQSTTKRMRRWMAIIRVTSVEKQITTLAQKIEILKEINLSVAEGETLSIMGASGSGKTTLLSLLAGLDTPTKGTIMLDGHSLEKMNEDERAFCRLGRVGFIFQNFDLLPHFTALENVMLPLELCRQSNAKQRATDLLVKMGLENRLKHFPRQLSGGEQQRVAIARAFSTHPKILFADEPTGNLDIHTGEKIIDLLFDLNSQMNTTLIFVTHDEFLAKRCQRKCVLIEGTLQETTEKSSSLT